MPSSPPVACQCGGLRINGKCNKCKTTKDNRANSNSRGYGYRWRQYSKEYRTENPWCVHCKRKNKSTRAKLVDHIKEIKGEDDELFWPETNHQPLCVACHNIKTELEKSGRYDHELDLKEARERQ